MSSYVQTVGTRRCIESDTLFHCQICPYTICHSCYQRHSITLSSKQLDTLFVILEGYHFPNTLPPSFTAVPVLPKSTYPSLFVYPSVNLQAIWNILSYIFTATKACRMYWLQVSSRSSDLCTQWSTTLDGHLLPKMCTTCTAKRMMVPLYNQQFEQALDRGTWMMCMIKLIIT